MSNFRYLFLPVDLPVEDGCTMIDAAGQEFIYRSDTHYDLDRNNFRRAEPFIVEYVFNQQKVVGVPSKDVTWLKNGDEVPRGLTERFAHIDDTFPNLQVIKIHCPTCGKLH